MNVFDLQIQIFLLLCIGYYLGYKGKINKNTRDQLTDLIIMIVLPCSILASFQIELSMDIIKSSIIVLITAILSQFAYIFINKFLYRHFDIEEQVSCKYATAVTNASFLGIPIILALYGSTGAVYASIFVIPQRIFMWAYGLPLYSAHSENIIKKILTHPCIVSIFASIVIMILYSHDIYLPQPIINTITSISSCTTSLSLIVIGSILSDVPVKEMINKKSIIYSIIRLIIIPVVMIIIMNIFQINSLCRDVCIILSAMPAATTTVILAQKYNRSPKFAAKLLVTSTLFSLVTIPFITFMLEIF